MLVEIPLLRNRAGLLPVLLHVPLSTAQDVQTLPDSSCMESARFSCSEVFLGRLSCLGFAEHASARVLVSSSQPSCRTLDAGGLAEVRLEVPREPCWLVSVLVVYLCRLSSPVAGRVPLCSASSWSRAALE